MTFIFLYVSYMHLLLIYFHFFMHFTHLPGKTHAFVFMCVTCLSFMFFYLPYINLIPVAFFIFQVRKRHRFFPYVLLWKINSPYVYKHLTKLKRPCQQMAFFSFSMGQLDGFSIDQMKFFFWAQGIRTMLLQRCYNISDYKAALQQPYYSQLQRAYCHFFTIFFRKF